jgi:hypothetical protein
VLTRGIDEFIVAHEFGHAVLGHNSKLRDLELSLGGKTSVLRSDRASKNSKRTLGRRTFCLEP